MAAVRVRRLKFEYRGFKLGYLETSYGCKAAWRSSFENSWNVSNLYADSNELEDVILLAKDCIDYQYKLEAREVEAGRKLTDKEFREYRD